MSSDWGLDDASRPSLVLAFACLFRVLLFRIELCSTLAHELAPLGAVNMMWLPLLRPLIQFGLSVSCVCTASPRSSKDACRLCLFTSQPFLKWHSTGLQQGSYCFWHFRNSIAKTALKIATKLVQFFFCVASLWILIVRSNAAKRACLGLCFNSHTATKPLQQDGLKAFKSLNPAVTGVPASPEKLAYHSGLRTPGWLMRAIMVAQGHGVWLVHKPHGIWGHRLGKRSETEDGVLSFTPYCLNLSSLNLRKLWTNSMRAAFGQVQATVTLPITRFNLVKSSLANNNQNHVVRMIYPILSARAVEPPTPRFHK